MFRKWENECSVSFLANLTGTSPHKVIFIWDTTMNDKFTLSQKIVLTNSWFPKWGKSSEGVTRIDFNIIYTYDAMLTLLCIKYNCMISYHPSQFYLTKVDNKMFGEENQQIWRIYKVHSMFSVSLCWNVISSIYPMRTPCEYIKIIPMPVF